MALFFNLLAHGRELNLFGVSPMSSRQSATAAGRFRSKIGAILVPVNPSLRMHELAYIYRDASVAVLIGSADSIDGIRGARRDAPDLKQIILAGHAVPTDCLSYDEVIQCGSDHLPIEETDNDDTAGIIYTAGTTGNTKGVMLTHYNWYMHVTGYYESALLDAWGVGVEGPVQGRGDGQEPRVGETAEVFGVARSRRWGEKNLLCACHRSSLVKG